MTVAINPEIRSQLSVNERQLRWQNLRKNFDLDVGIATIFGDEFWKRRDSIVGAFTQVNLQSWTSNTRSNTNMSWRQAGANAEVGPTKQQ